MFRESVARACEAAAVKEALFHNLRRTALTNMIEAGLSEKEAWRSVGTEHSPSLIAITSSAIGG